MTRNILCVAASVLVLAACSKKQLPPEIRYDAEDFTAAAVERIAHQLANRTDADVVYLEIGTRAPREQAHYPDDDLSYRRDEAGNHFHRKDGTPY